MTAPGLTNAGTDAVPDDPLAAFVTAFTAVEYPRPLVRPDAEAAAADSYRALGHRAPVRWLWVRSVREASLLVLLLPGILRAVGNGRSWDQAWRKAAAGTPPDGPRAGWLDALAGHVAPQVAAWQPGGWWPGAGTPVTYDALPSFTGGTETYGRIHALLGDFLARQAEVARATADQMEWEGERESASAMRAGIWANGAIYTAILEAAWREAAEGVPMPPAWDAILRLFRTAAGSLFLDGVGILIDLPLIDRTDEAGRLHALDGPALECGDGFAIWAIHGVGVPRAVIEAGSDLSLDLVRSAGEDSALRRRALIELFGGPDRYRAAAGATPETIAAEPDVALRRDLIEDYGLGRFLAAAGQVVDHDLDGAGRPRRLWRAPRRFDAPLVAVEVSDATAGPDGSRRTHWLRVPPETSTCQSAVAWTFGLRADEYQPRLET